MVELTLTMLLVYRLTISGSPKDFTPGFIVNYFYLPIGTTAEYSIDSEPNSSVDLAALKNFV